MEQGVDTVFGYPGGSVLNIYDALYEYSDKIRHILTAHEQGASHAADGYARSTGRTGVVIATSGPGATNLVTGLATANMDSVPVVAITGNVGCSSLGLDSFQEVDITGVTIPITKHNYIVKDISKLADTIREAFYLANSGRKGPVLIDVPKDVTAAVCEYTPQKPASIPVENHTTVHELERAAAMIMEAKRPFVYTGGGVIASEAEEPVLELVNRMDAPVSSSLMGQGSFDNTDPRYMGMLGMHGTVTAAKAIENCDLFVGLGTRFSDRVSGDKATFAKNAKILQIDIDPAEVNKNISVDLALIGDVKAVLEQLLPLLPQQNHGEWMEQIQSWKKEYPLVMTADDPEAVTPQDVIETLDELTKGEAIIATEVGQHQMRAAQPYKLRHPRSLVPPGGLPTMGYGFGAAMGAQVGNPDKRVINIAGDGSFHMNCNELVTAYKFQIPMIELLFNNNVLGMVRQWQRLFYGRRFSQTTLDRGTDYMLLAQAYHIKGLRITKKSDIRPVLEEALSLHEPVLIECVIDRDINVLPMVPAGADITKPITHITIEEKEGGAQG